MSFDAQAFGLFGLTPAEAIEYVRRETAAGRRLSLKAAAVFLDILDKPPGRPPKLFTEHDFKIAEMAGKLQSLHKHGYLSTAWKPLVLERFSVSRNTLDRTLKALRPFWDSAYVTMTVRLWVMGLVERPVIPERISAGTITQQLYLLLGCREITIAQLNELEGLIGPTEQILPPKNTPI